MKCFHGYCKVNNKFTEIFEAIEIFLISTSSGFCLACVIRSLIAIRIVCITLRDKSCFSEFPSTNMGWRTLLLPQTLSGCNFGTRSGDLRQIMEHKSNIALMWRNVSTISINHSSSRLLDNLMRKHSLEWNIIKTLIWRIEAKLLYLRSQGGHTERQKSKWMSTLTWSSHSVMNTITIISGTDLWTSAHVSIPLHLLGSHYALTCSHESQSKLVQAMHLIRIGKYNFLESDKVITVLISNPWQRFLRTVRSGSSCSMLFMSVGDWLTASNKTWRSEGRDGSGWALSRCLEKPDPAKVTTHNTSLHHYATVVTFFIIGSHGWGSRDTMTVKTRRCVGLATPRPGQDDVIPGCGRRGDTQSTAPLVWARTGGVAAPS